MSKFFRTKIRIPQPYNEREIMALQSTLFSMGMKWSSEPLTYRKEPSMFGIFIDAYGFMTWTRDAREFNACEYYELSMVTTTQVDIVPPKRQSVVVLNDKYDLEDLRKALSTLSTVDY